MTDTRLITLEEYRQNVKKGANWFYWIAGLSLVNAGLTMGGANVHFIIGLAYTEIAAAISALGESYSQILGGALILVTLGVFALFGYRGGEMKKWAFLVGMALYAIDGVLYLAFKDFLPAAFHAYALYNLYQGYRNISLYQALEADIIQHPHVDVTIEQTPAETEIATETVAIEEQSPTPHDPYASNPN